MGEFNAMMQELKFHPVKTTFQCVSLRGLLRQLATRFQRENIGDMLYEHHQNLLLSQLAKDPGFTSSLAKHFDTEAK